MTLVSRCRMIAELCWQSRRSTVCLRRFRSSSTSSLSWQTTFSWMPASQSPSPRYRVVRLWPHQIQPMVVKSSALFKTVHLLFVCLFQDNRVHIGPKMEIRVVTLGLDGAGKTTILFKLKQDEFMQPIPTIGNGIHSTQLLRSNPVIFHILLNQVCSSPLKVSMWRQWNTRTWNSPSGTWVENISSDLFGNTITWTLKVSAVVFTH